MSGKLMVRCSSRIHNFSSNFKAEESSFESIITNNNQRLVLELSVRMMMWQSVSLPLSPLPSRALPLESGSLTRWLTVAGGGYLSSLSDIRASIFWALCINDSNLSCSGAQMQVWIWRRAAYCSVWLLLSGATFMYFYHYFYNNMNRLIERQNYLRGKMRVPTSELPCKNPLVETIEIFCSLVIFARINKKNQPVKWAKINLKWIIEASKKKSSHYNTLSDPKTSKKEI